jgi:small conductance mechanosensitive channel
MGFLSKLYQTIVQGSGGWAQGLLVVLAVALALAALSRFLGRNSSTGSGHRFRNQLITFGAWFVGLLIIVLGLPLDPQMRQQLLTLLGILLSAAIALSGSTLLGNAMAGIMLKTVRNFRSGDFISTGDHFGRVTERGLFHTEIQTADRDLTTLPNLLLATSAVKVVRSSGTVVSATISLGYDQPHDRVEKLLIQAAESVGLGDPFVQILELGDFSVTYRAAGLLTETKQLLAFRSRLRGAILDTLHSAGVEIVSPAFTNARVLDAGKLMIPPRSRATAAENGQDAAPVNVVFDKAEDAASLARLRERLVATEAELQEVRKEDKKNPRVGFLERMRDNLILAIESAEERERMHED